MAVALLGQVHYLASALLASPCRSDATAARQILRPAMVAREVSTMLVVSHQADLADPPLKGTVDDTPYCSGMGHADGIPP